MEYMLKFSYWGRLAFAFMIAGLFLNHHQLRRDFV